jgi:hypothetical protein
MVPVVAKRSTSLTLSFLVQLSLQLTPPFFSYHKQALPAGINAQPTAIKTAVPLGFVPIASVESSRHCSDTTHAFCLVEITRDVNQSKYFFLNNLGTTMKNLLINYAGAGKTKVYSDPDGGYILRLDLTGFVGDLFYTSLTVTVPFPKSSACPDDLMMGVLDCERLSLTDEPTEYPPLYPGGPPVVKPSIPTLSQSVWLHVRCCDYIWFRLQRSGTGDL